MVYVTGDLLGAALRGDVLCVCELGATALAGKAQQVVGYDRYRTTGTSLPWRIGGGVHHNLTDDSPAVVVRVAAGDEEAGEGFGNSGRSGFGRVSVEMA